MIIPLQRPIMDLRYKAPTLLLMVYINCVAGLNLPQPDKLIVDMSEEEIIVLWQDPVDAPSNFKYNVQMGKYSGDWAMVASCTNINKTFCDLSSFIDDYRVGYKVRVQLVSGKNESEWTKKKFLPSDSKLQSPSFTLWATSSTLTIHIQQKLILKKLFPYGTTYTIFLEERGKHNKNTTAYLKDDSDEDQMIQTFSSLHWGTEYCVRIMVEGSGALFGSSVSPEQCLRLPEQEWYIMAVTSTCILVALVFAVIVAAILLCYLRRPEKTPTALKSIMSGWFPLPVEEGPAEVVTDKGWFLSNHRKEVKNFAKVPVTHVMIPEDSEEEDRRTSMDSGVSMDSHSTKSSRERPPRGQEDSGCGSLGGSESSTSNQTDYPLQEESTHTDISRKRGDSGVGLGFQFHSSSMSLNGQDSGSLKDTVGVRGNYCRQSPSAVQIKVCDEEEAFTQILHDSVLAEVVTGYRAGPQSCICSGAGQCTWCHKQGLYGTRTVCTDPGLQKGKCNSVDTYKEITFANYSKETQMDTAVMDDLERTLVQMRETFPLLTGLTKLPLVEGGQDFNMNNVSLSLCDVQLTTDQDTLELF